MAILERLKTCNPHEVVALLKAIEELRTKDNE